MKNRLQGVISSLLLLGILLLSVMPLMAQGSPIDTDGDVITIDTEQAAEQIIQVSGSVAEQAAEWFNTFINNLYNVPQSDAVRLALVIGGIILLMLGARVYKNIILIAGAIVLAANLVAIVGSDNLTVNIVLIIIGAILGALIARFLFYVAVFLIGAYVGIIATASVILTFDVGPVPAWIILLAALIGGFVMVALSFELLLILSSIVGAQMLVLGLGVRPVVLWVLILTIVGILIQFILARRLGFSLRRRRN